MLSKKMLIPMAAVAVIATGAVGVARVSAATNPSDPQASLVQKLADTFHLDKAKVQAVVDQNRADKQASREAAYEARLTQAVTDGKLTAAQKALILTEHTKLEAEATAAMSDTASNRHTAMKTMRDEAKTWAAQNNIAESWLMGPGHLRGGMGGPKMGQPTDSDDTSSPSPTPSPGA